MEAPRMNRFEGKICFCPASTQGIGLVIAERFALEGGKVIICSRTQENVDFAVNKLSKYGVEGHVCHIANTKER